MKTIGVPLLDHHSAIVQWPFVVASDLLSSYPGKEQAAKAPALRIAEEREEQCC